MQLKAEQGLVTAAAQGRAPARKRNQQCKHVLEGPHCPQFSPILLSSAGLIVIAEGQTVQFVGGWYLMLSHVVDLHLHYSPASSAPALTSPSCMKKRMRHFQYLAPGHGHMQPEKQPCHMPSVRLGRASITRRWPHMGHQPHCLQEALAQSMELERPQGSEGLFTGD